MAACGHPDTHSRGWYYHPHTAGWALLIECCVLWWVLLLGKSYLKLAKACLAGLGGDRHPMTAMVPHSRRCRILQSASILGDHCVRRHLGWGTMVAAVGHLGHDVSTDVVGLLWVVSYIGICRIMYQAIGNAYPTRWWWASPRYWSHWLGSLYAKLVVMLRCPGKDIVGECVWQRWWQNRKKRNRRWQFIQQASLYLNQSWWLPSSYGHHGAPLPAFKHTAISKHTMEQVYMLKLEKTIINHVY